MRGFVALALAFFVVAVGLTAQDEPEDGATSPTETNGGGALLNRGDRLNGGLTRGLFTRTLDATRPSVVKLLDRNSTVICLGTIITSDGYIVTKATEVTDRRLKTLSVQMHDKTVRRARLASVQKDNDVALLKLDRPGDVTPIGWCSSSDFPIGTWVGAASQKKAGGFYGGILSANTRRIERRGGALGVVLRDDPAGEGVAVSAVVPDSGAERAGIEPDDVILSINGARTTTIRVLQELVKQHDAKEKVTVVLRRNRGTLRYDVTLGHRTVLFKMFERNQKMSGRTSNRKTGFDRVLQHDMSLAPEAMGGPLLLLDGNAIGINIARVDRVTSFSLPVEVVRPIIDQLVTAHRALE